MRRRDFLFSPATALLPPLPAALNSAPVYTLVLAGSRPLHTLADLWRFGPPLRVLTRAHTDWWPSTSELPPRWQAWVSIPTGGAVFIDCRTAAESRLPRHQIVAALARALTSPSAAAA